MKRSLSLVLLTVSLGMPAVIAETCHVDFKEVWARKVAAIKAWDLKHPAYMKAHHLDRDMSDQTRRMKERAGKALEVMCAQVEDVAAGSPLVPGGPSVDSGMEGIADRSLLVALDVEDSPQQMIQEEEYPNYEATRRDSLVDGERGSYPGFPGWFGGGGYLPGGGRGTATAPPPVVPIAETPEPSTLALTFAPLLLLAIRRLKKTAQLRLEEYAA
jgi:hypothetical protein